MTNKTTIKLYLLNWKKKRGCVNCGWNEHPEILVAHHKDPKEKEFEIDRIHTWARLVRELEKCIPLCQNCHVWLHKEEN